MSFSIGLHQPYFFPYKGYFELINSVDLFIAFDTVQYIKGGWINRNRVKDGWITVPVHKKHKSKINEVKIIGKKWKQSFFNKLYNDYHKSRRFNQVTEWLDETVFPDFKTISELNIHTLKETCQLLGITTPIVALSDMSLKLDKVEEPGDWALRVCEALGATEYHNLPGGKKLFDRRKWRKIKLKFMETTPSLSIIHDLYENTFSW